MAARNINHNMCSHLVIGYHFLVFATILLLLLAQGHQSSKHDYGGARPKHQTTSKHPVSSESTLLGPHTKMDQGIP